ncbi:hypothetical protein GLAREA_08857 [Glarea lozoyensis ATCC 20868]|uniref:Nephrocystin 3-like N-terminal domain-containing protein n=1 Tax=Glarea lozoyensis (strain ATCC 20868 / MF5171) TaxID=1116229 RepID=S3DHS6_GLAL2|nr:uncharacterized protein GLAREA_08857 [Glarea lozoyensis ATCC 20868]EPE36694.1 hypothetical protein GLAREA_08857 [Glarea lozoyensis ATCC 20868]
MKHLFDDERTKKYLLHWARNNPPVDSPLHLATFFFWNSGTAEQKSQAGMLRALLHQILDQSPGLVPIVFPDIWAAVYSRFLDRERRKTKSLPMLNTWKLQNLKLALKTLAKQTQMPLKLLFLIDGLDEFDEDPEDLIGMVRETIACGKGRIRFCLSSRPWVIFEDSFGQFANLKMSNLGKMRANTAFQRLAEAEPETTDQLVQEIVHKAEGVFLWVRIVVKSLLSGMRNLDDMSDLWRRLELLPKELEPLYEHLVVNIEPVYLEWVSKVFRIVQTSRGFDYTTNYLEIHQSRSPARRNPLTLIALHLAIAENFDLKAARAAKPGPLRLDAKPWQHN